MKSFHKTLCELPFLFILVALKDGFYDSANQFHPSQQVVMYLSAITLLLFQGKQQPSSSKVTSGEESPREQSCSNARSASQNGLFLF